MSEDPYRRMAAWYDRIFEPMNHALRLIGLRMYEPEPGMSVLDVGCGTGVHLDLYRKYRCALFGIDVSPSMLEIAKRRLGGEAELRLADAAELPYADATFDLIISMLALHEMHPATRSAVLRQVKRVLKHSGRLLLIDFHPGPIRPIRGWLTKAVIFLSEVAAGGEHFRNYRQFMAAKGLVPLIEANSLMIEKHKVVGGGALGVFLLSRS